MSPGPGVWEWGLDRPWLLWRSLRRVICFCRSIGSNFRASGRYALILEFIPELLTIVILLDSCVFVGISSQLFLSITWGSKTSQSSSSEAYLIIMFFIGFWLYCWEAFFILGKSIFFLTILKDIADSFLVFVKYYVSWVIYLGVTIGSIFVSVAIGSILTMLPPENGCLLAYLCTISSVWLL
jgi:hypothetical protein